MLSHLTRYELDKGARAWGTDCSTRWWYWCENCSLRVQVCSFAPPRSSHRTPSTWFCITSMGSLTILKYAARTHLSSNTRQPPFPPQSYLVAAPRRAWVLSISVTRTEIYTSSHIHHRSGLGLRQGTFGPLSRDLTEKNSRSIAAHPLY